MKNKKPVADNSATETYEDRAQVLKKEARVASVKILTSQYKSFREMVDVGQQSVIDAVNLARTMGDTIWEITGHENLIPAEFNQLALALPDAGLNFAKECLAIRRKFDNPVTDYAEARAVWDRLIVQLELLPKPKRGEENLHPKEPVETFLAAVINIKNESARLIKTQPIESWPSFYRQSFIREAKPIHDLYDVAILQEKGASNEM